MKEDILNRQEDIDRLINVIECISNNNRSCCFALEGNWGVGKTYVLDALENEIKKIQTEEKANDKYFVFNYNCWKYDYYEEPSVAIVSSMLDKVNEEESLFGKDQKAFFDSAWSNVKTILRDISGEFIKNKIGINVVEIAKNANDETEDNVKESIEFDKMFAFKKTLEVTRKKLEELAQQKPIVFIVDELDRCLPTYSIKVLERLHHLFEGIENIIMIISIDRTQLEYSIKQIYGENADVDKYLKKFINFSIILKEGEINKNIKTKYREYFEKFQDFSMEDEVVFDELIYTLFQDLDVRTQEKLVYKAKVIHEILTDRKEKCDSVLLCFEIMWVVLSYLYGTNTLHWIVELNNATFPSLLGAIGTARNAFFARFEESATKGFTTVHTMDDRTIHYKNIKNNLNGKIYWIVAAVLSERTATETCGRYYYSNYEELTVIVDYARKFRDMCDIIK